MCELRVLGSLVVEFARGSVCHDMLAGGLHEVHVRRGSGLAHAHAHAHAHAAVGDRVRFQAKLPMTVCCHGREDCPHPRRGEE